MLTEYIFFCTLFSQDCWKLFWKVDKKKKSNVVKRNKLFPNKYNVKYKYTYLKDNNTINTNIKSN